MTASVGSRRRRLGVILAGFAIGAALGTWLIVSAISAFVTITPD